MDDETAEQSSIGLTVVEAICLVAAGLVYFVSLGIISGLGSHVGGEPATAGLDEFFAGIVIFMLWLPLAAFVSLACRAGRLSTPFLGLGLALCGTGLVGSCSAIDLMDPPSVARFTPMLMPVLAAAFGAWAHFAGRFPKRWRVIGAATFVVLFIGAFWPVSIAQQRWNAAAPAREAAARKVEADYARSQAAAAAQWEAGFRALGPDNHLEQFFPYLGGDHDAETLAKIRAVHSLQADVVRLLDGGASLPDLRRLPEFGVEVTPEVCRSYRARIAGKLAETGPDPVRNENTSELATYIDNFRWLHGHGCNMADQATQLAARIRQHPYEPFHSDAAMFDAIR